VKIPALLTTMSIPPNCRTTPSTASITDASVTARVFHQARAGNPVEATVRADDAVPAELRTRVFADHVEVSGSGNTLEIRDLHQRAAGDEKRGSKVKYEGWDVSVRVFLPRPLAVNASSGVGSITVDTARGDVSLDSGVGSVTMKLPDSSLGSVHAQSGAGSIRLELGGVRGKLSASSGAGNVVVDLRSGVAEGARITSGAGSLEVTLPASVAGQLDVDTGAGSVEVDPALGGEVERGLVGASARGQIRGGGPTYRIHTGAGSIDVKASGSTRSPDRLR